MGVKDFFPPVLLYCRSLVHFWHRFDLDKAKLLLVPGPSCRYYTINGDNGIRDLQCLIYCLFKRINLFFVDDTNLTIHTHYILHHLETYHVDIEIASNNKIVSSDSKSNVDFPSIVEYDGKRFKIIDKLRRMGLSDKLKNYKELEK